MDCFVIEKYVTRRTVQGGEGKFLYYNCHNNYYVTSHNFYCHHGVLKTPFFKDLAKVSICLLHAVMRIGEGLMTLIAQSCFNSFAPGEADRRVKELGLRCRSLFTGFAQKDSTWKFSVEKGNVEKVSLSRQRVTKLLGNVDNWNGIVDILFKVL